MIYFRVDSNSQIASGHLMRCISLARAFKKNGYEIVFLIADAHSVPLIENAKFSYVNLNSQWNDLSKEIDKVSDILVKDQDSLLIIDTYYVNRLYTETMCKVSKVCYLGSKKENLGNIDALINYSTNIDYEYYNKTYDDSTRLLLGPSYAPLREEFQNITFEMNHNIKNILLTTGNTDEKNLVYKILNEIIEIDFFENIKMDVIIGSMFKYDSMIYEKFSRYHNIQFHTNVKSMSNIMLQSDLAISANGTTVYELAASGVPAITFAMVSEQEESAEALNKLGVVDYCGAMFENEQLCITHIVDKVKRYYNNFQARYDMAHKAKEIIDGKGAQRIVEMLSSILK